MSDIKFKLVFASLAFLSALIGWYFGKYIASTSHMDRLDRLESLHNIGECYKVITGKNSSFETPSHKMAEKMIAKGYIVEECD